jgi:hypothetical protein
MLNVGNSVTARSTWFPQMARVIFAWTGARAFTAKLTLPQK